ncbi:polysaccharide deacetylase family protein [Streptomyces sp. NPDC006193]|uniref:polysaccharide deacetylase family protein n=1 Tax=Streptomyces sp. NPDC006193 TaxID=3155717 RepID=UPI0033AE66F8
MARHGGRGWYGRMIAAALGVTALAAATSVWSAEAGQTHGQPATPGASARAAAPKAAPVSAVIAHSSDRGAHAVNITIDDGPDPVWTPQVLRLLRDHGVKATFCMVGTQAQAHPDLVRKVVAAGHRLCDHTVSHDTGMDGKSRAYQSQQVVEAERQITKASGGVRPLYYRAPGGAFTPYSRQLAASHGMRPLGWNVDSKDFERPGTDAIVATVKSQLANGPTLLFHDAGGDRAQTVAALRVLLPWLKEQGYAFGFPVR